jgi:hypothetical protein
MRKIESLMNAAIENGKDWKLDNTEVIHNNGLAEVYLYSRLIAEIGEQFIRLSDGDYRSTTTKSRLNAILQGNGTGDEKIYQKDGEWFIAYDRKVETFANGVTLR